MALLEELLHKAEVIHSYDNCKVCQLNNEGDDMEKVASVVIGFVLAVASIFLGAMIAYWLIINVMMETVTPEPPRDTTPPHIKVQTTRAMQTVVEVEEDSCTDLHTLQNQSVAAGEYPQTTAHAIFLN